jgi:CUE domain
MSEEEEEQFENEEQPDQINLESAVEFIQGMIPDLDTETIE